MATTIQAVTRYRPRLIASHTIGLGELAEDMSRSSIVTAALAALVLADLQHALVLALRAGQAVKLPGFGRFSLELRSDGTVRPIMRIDHTLISAVAKLDDYHGEVRHRKHIGLTAAEMVALWNAEHPEDPVIVPPREDEAR